MIWNLNLSPNSDLLKLLKLATIDHPLPIHEIFSVQHGSFDLEISIVSVCVAKFRRS